jgi:peptide/nickel transport system ATP-binding protein
MINNQKVLSVSDFQVSFPASGLRAVKGISFDLYRGRTLAVVGESGSGKSLTAFALLGLLPKGSLCSGTIILSPGEQSLLTLSEKEWRSIRGKRICMIFQEPMTALNPVQRIGDQILESILQHQKISKSEAKELAKEWLQKVQLDPSLYTRFPHELSGGQKQRVVIAMAMVNRPDILIADEPTTALDAAVQKEIITLMQQLQQEHGSALFFITHDLALAAGIADELMVLRKGECVEYGPAKEIWTHPAENYTKALLHCRPGKEAKGYRLPTVADFELRESVTPIPTASHPMGAELLRLNKVSVAFHSGKSLFAPKKPVLAVREVSFEISKGETLGLVGASGCGKSTIGKAIMGLLPISSGRIEFPGMDVTADNFRKVVQLVFQDPYASLDPLFTVRELIEEPLQIQKIGDALSRKEKVSTLLNAVGLAESDMNRYPHEFSGGQRQRISIARALALEPQILVCDESVSALDISVQAQVLNLLKDLQSKLGLAYLFITHDLTVVHYMADRILVMDQGQIVESGSPDEILNAPEHPYTQKLVASMPEHAFH